MKKHLLIFTLCIIACTTPSHAQTWLPLGSPDFSAGEAQRTCITIDRHGTPYVVYTDYFNGDKVTVMKFDGTSWVAVGSPGFSAGTVFGATIATDTAGIPYVAYPDTGAQKITVMKFDGSNWVAVGSTGFSAGQVISTSIAIDKNNTPYVLYADGGAALFGQATVQKFNGSSWVAVGSPGFSPGYAGFAAMALDTGGTPWVVFEDNASANQASVMRFNGTSWVYAGSPDFSSGGTNYTTIAIDRNGTPYVAYEDEGFVTYKATVMKFDGSSWAPVGGAGLSLGQAQYTSIATDSAGTPYVAYQDNSSIPAGKATVMKYNGTSWVNVGRIGFTSNIATNTSLAIWNGIPYIAYTDSGVGNATVMKFIPTTEVNNIANTASSVSIFPDPSHGAFTLNISSAQNEPATITITNILGEKVKQLTALTNQNTDIQLDAAPGLYFITAVTKDGSFNGKIIVE